MSLSFLANLFRKPYAGYKPCFGDIFVGVAFVATVIYYAQWWGVALCLIIMALGFVINVVELNVVRWRINRYRS